jgi:hypothetical protein
MKLDDNYIEVFLSNDDKTLTLCIGFFGYTYKMVENYIKKHYIDCDKNYVQKWTNVKYLK